MSHFGTQGLAWALSGVDMAMWDLVGKICGQPLHRVWGSAWRTQSPFYGDIPPGDPGRMAEEAREWVDRGFRTLYFKVGFDPDLDVARVRAGDGSAGQSVDLVVHVHIQRHVSFSLVGKMTQPRWPARARPRKTCNVDSQHGRDHGLRSGPLLFFIF
jgi:L-alanine-DL-glutamate epimerase-like enolase superfamily enzyme